MNREVVNVTTLPIPAELAALLHAASGAHTRVQTQTTALWRSVGALWCHQASFFFVCVCACVCAGGEELHSDCLAVVQAPTVQVDPQLTLPLDINNYLITHYIRAIFRVKMNYTSTEHSAQHGHGNKGIPLGKLIYMSEYLQSVCLAGAIVWNADSPTGEFAHSDGWWAETGSCEHFQLGTFCITCRWKTNQTFAH